MAVELEEEHVHKVYSQIAAHFSDTRFKPWPRVAEFLKEQSLGSLIADVGCGNGKYLGVNSHVYMLGSDMCPELVSIGRSRGHEVITCDCLNLPYKSNLFDCIISIAVIHHLSTENRRLEALQEMARVLRPGGEMLVYVWAMEQERKKFNSQDVMVPWYLQPKYSPGGHKPVGAKEKATKISSKKKEKKRRKLLCDVAHQIEETSPSSEEASAGDGMALLGDLGDLMLEDEDLGCRDSRKPQPTAVTCSMSQSCSNSTDRTAHKQELSHLGYTTYQRYYHVFREGELVSMIYKVPGLNVEKQFYDHENWCVLATKSNSSTS